MIQFNWYVLSNEKNKIAGFQELRKHQVSKHTRYILLQLILKQYQPISFGFLCVWSWEFKSRVNTNPLCTWISFSPPVFIKTNWGTVFLHPKQASYRPATQAGDYFLKMPVKLLKAATGKSPSQIREGALVQENVRTARQPRRRQHRRRSGAATPCAEMRRKAEIECHMPVWLTRIGMFQDRNWSEPKLELWETQLDMLSKDEWIFLQLGMHGPVEGYTRHALISPAHTCKSRTMLASG